MSFYIEFIDTYIFYQQFTMKFTQIQTVKTLELFQCQLKMLIEPNLLIYKNMPTDMLSVKSCLTNTLQCSLKLLNLKLSSIKNQVILIYFMHKRYRRALIRTVQIYKTSNV